MEMKRQRRFFLKSLFSASAFVFGSFLPFKSRRYKDGLVRKAEARESIGEGRRIKKVAVEEHFLTEEFKSFVKDKTGYVSQSFGDRSKNLVDIGEGRIKAMDECGVDMQVLSLGLPGIEPFKNAADAVRASRMVNDGVAAVIRKYPDRFAGFCCLPLQDPDAAADELERAVNELGLKAAMVNTKVWQWSPERWLSDQKYEVVFERFNKVGVPLYLHADGPSTDSVGLHIVPEVMRLVNSDLLDKYPKLQFILGHGGESLPFWLNRLDERWPHFFSDRPKIFSQYFKEHFYVSTSSQCWPLLLKFNIDALGAERILFATDYPHESMSQHVEFIDSVPINDGDREKICHVNAEKLFKLS